MTETWSTLRFLFGMAILSAVCVVAQGLVLVHELSDERVTSAQPL
jgi:hypothetical protein